MNALSGSRHVLSSETLSRFKSVSTATVSMQLLKRGIRRSWMSGPVSIHAPGHAASGRIAGEAFTMRFLPLREDLGTLESYARDGSIRDAIEAVPADAVVVIDARGGAGCGTLGDILVGRLKVIGAAGVVSDGPVRDIAAVRDVGLPVYCCGAAAPPSIAGLVFAGWQEPIGCGGAAVLPGDIIVADQDGAVVVPRDLADGVAESGLEQERFEAFVQERVAAGAPVKGLYPPDDDTLKDYEAWLSKR